MWAAVADRPLLLADTPRSPRSTRAPPGGTSGVGQLALDSRDVNPGEFAEKWAGSTRSERAASQEHFIDLCRMLGVPTPNEADPTGERYAFEKGAEKTGGGDGYADVWKRGCFAWEYKGKRK